MTVPRTPMTCDECLDRLTTADLRVVAGWPTTAYSVAAPAAHAEDPHTPAVRAALREHLGGCAACAAAAALLVDGHWALARPLAEASPSRPFPAVAAHAWAAARRAWRRRAVWVATAAGAAAVVWLGERYAAPEVRRWVAPPPPVVTETFTLTCLSPEQAASILRPHLPTPENPRWQAERFSVSPAEHGIRAVTVRAPRTVVDRVPALLERFEPARDAACRGGAASRPQPGDGAPQRSSDARQNRDDGGAAP